MKKVTKKSKPVSLRMGAFCQYDRPVPKVLPVITCGYPSDPCHLRSIRTLLTLNGRSERRHQPTVPLECRLSRPRLAVGCTTAVAAGYSGEFINRLSVLNGRS